MGSAISGYPVVVPPVPEALLDRYVEAVLADSPIAYWLMDEASGLPQDISGGVRHMTAVSGSPTYEQAGPFGVGSIAEAIQYPSAAYHERAVVSTVTTNLTVEMWVRRSGNTSGDLFMHGTTSGGFQIEFTTTGGVWRVNVPGVGTLGTHGDALADGTWYHLAVTRGASLWFAYLDGRGDNLGSASPATPVGNTRIVGAGATSLRVAHLAYYNSELSATDIARRILIATGEI